MHHQRVSVGGGLQPRAALVVISLSVVTLQTQSTAPLVAGCCLVVCSVVSRQPPCSCDVVGVSYRIHVGLEPVLDSSAPSQPAVAAAP